MKQIISGMFVALVVISSGCATLERADLKPPGASTSEYLKTTLGGFRCDTKAKLIRYSVGFKILKPLPDPAIAQVEFENPRDPTRPLVNGKKLTSNDTQFSIESPPVRGLQAGHNYEVLVRIISDANRITPIASHRQLIRSEINQKLLKGW